LKPVLFLLSVISHNALNLYGAVLSIITLVQTFAYRWIPTAKSRAVISILVLAACGMQWCLPPKTSSATSSTWCWHMQWGLRCRLRL
jgi:purine-cytosine permease-like protein